MPRKHLYIPDTQVRAGVPLDHLDWIGELILDEKPDVIIHGGDHFDMPSLSSYDKGKKASEGRRIQSDLDSGHEAMERLLLPLREYNLVRILQKKKRYLPRRVFLLGNHEERLDRHIEANAVLEGVFSFPETYELNKRYGWEVVDYLKPVIIDGVAYAHYFYNQLSGRPYGGTCHTKIKNIGASFVQGHVQGLDMATRCTNTGQQQWGIVAGSCYLHDEGYRGPQANDHWNGVLLLDNVEGGDFDPRPISLETLRGIYGR